MLKELCEPRKHREPRQLANEDFLQQMIISEKIYYVQFIIEFIYFVQNH